MKRRSFIKNSTYAGLSASMYYSCTQKLDAEYLILGGGYSGLYLAYLLEKAGKDYIVLEGSNRLGGRLFTHPEIKRDVGGRGVGDRYDETMQLVKELNVELVDISAFMNSPTAVYYQGKLYPEWKDMQTNPRLYEFILPNKIAELNKLDGWFQRPDLDITYAEMLSKAGRTKDEIDIINISAMYNDVYKTSAINAYHSKAFRKFNESKVIYNFKGGAENFIGAIVDKLKHPVLTNKRVEAIKDSGDMINVKTADGSEYKSKKAISTLPFSTLRDVNIDSDLNERQEQAINDLAYSLVTQIHLEAKERFWEDDGAPASMWTDTPIERVMDMNPIPEQTDLVCWVNGTGTAYFDDMSDSEIADATLKIMSQVRPASEGKLEYIGTHNWGKYEFNKGAFVEFAPGQASWFKNMILPAGNLHFAGEHTAAASRGIEAAAESARRVFNELMS